MHMNVDEPRRKIPAAPIHDLRLRRCFRFLRRDRHNLAFLTKHPSILDEALRKNSSDVGEKQIHVSVVIHFFGAGGRCLIHARLKA